MVLALSARIPSGPLEQDFRGDAAICIGSVRLVAGQASRASTLNPQPSTPLPPRALLCPLPPVWLGDHLVSTTPRLWACALAERAAAGADGGRELGRVGLPLKGAVAGATLRHLSALGSE